MYNICIHNWNRPFSFRYFIYLFVQYSYTKKKLVKNSIVTVQPLCRDTFHVSEYVHNLLFGKEFSPPVFIFSVENNSQAMLINRRH